MPLLTKPRDELRSDEPGSADHHDLHTVASMLDRAVDAIGPTHTFKDRSPRRFVTSDCPPSHFHGLALAPHGAGSRFRQERRSATCSPTSPPTTGARVVDCADTPGRQAVAVCASDSPPFFPHSPVAAERGSPPVAHW